MSSISGRLASHRHVIARESNVVRVDFNREPDPPAPRFPGAGAMREHGREARDGIVARARAAGQPCEMNLVLR